MGKLRLRPFTPLVWIATAWIGAWFTRGEYRGYGLTAWGEVIAFLNRFFLRAFGGFPAAQSYAQDIVRCLSWAASPTLGTVAAWAVFLVPIGFIVRFVARARARSGAADPIDRVRRWVGAHPRWTQAALAFLPALWGIEACNVLLRHWYVALGFASVLPIAAISSLVHYLAARSVTRTFLAPTVDPSEESRVEIGPDEIAFDAVAVTPRTLGIVAAFTAFMVLFPFVVAKLPILELYRHGQIGLYLFAGYAGFAAISAAAFRLASRVAVGVDGVLVKGTARTRFFAYRDLDSVRVASGDLELVRRGKAVLRLQLHGADAVRRDAVAARIRENIERVQRGEGAVAAQLVAASTRDGLARVASGGADYRAASLSREALWALIEGPAVDAGARRAAAEALAKTCDPSERARLRVAAEHCADPRVRVALEELAEETPEAERAAAATGRISPFRAA